MGKRSRLKKVLAKEVHSVVGPMLGKGSLYPSQLPRGIYVKLLEDVVVGANVMFEAYRQSNGAKGIDPETNYCMAYSKTKGRCYVQLWKGSKEFARANGKLAQYDVADFLSGAGDFQLMVRKKEVLMNAT